MAEETKDESVENLALCVVGDIRGFTTMQTRVHEFVFESIKHERKAADRVRQAYKEYVEASTKVANTILTQSLGHRKVLGKKGYVIKSTGDGYLIAVSVPVNKHKLFAGSIGEMSDLIASAFALADSSDLNGSGDFGKLTRSFLEKYGHHIGINIDDVTQEMNRHRASCHHAAKGNSRFRISVGVSMGHTTFFKPPRSAGQSGPPEDVSGYGVNLAFRLCDQAGRGYDPEDKRCTPSVLLDRRVGNALLNYRDSPFQVLPWSEPLNLKGFEEAWAYYLAPKPITAGE